MNSKLKLALIILAALIVIVLAVVLISVLTGGGEEPGEATHPAGESAPAASGEPSAAPSETPPPEEPAVDPAGQNVTTATIAVGGDIVMHTGLNTEALTGEGTYDYSPIFGVLPELIADADYAVCTLSSTLADGAEYTAYPLFRSPTAIAADIAEAGFDLVNTASSHLADSFKDGINSTLDSLDAAALAHVGTYRSEEERAASGNRYMAEVNGISVAFLAYTCDTNRVPLSGFEYAASVCTKDYLSGGTEVDYELMNSDITAAREAGADIVFVFMSWGEEFATEPSSLQYEIADALITYGADVIIGGHCRVPQPMEMRTVRLDDGSEESGFVCYSLGNMLSCQNDIYTDISAVLSLELSLDNDTGEASVTGVSYRPIYMADLYDYGINDYGWHYRMVDLHAAIASWESGSPWDFLTEDIYRDMVTALASAHELYGEEFDA